MQADGSAKIDDIEFKNGNFYVTALIHEGYNFVKREVIVSPFTRIRQGYYEHEWIETLCFDAKKKSKKYWIEVREY
jgi:hypothetical protein